MYGFIFTEFFRARHKRVRTSVTPHIEFNSPEISFKHTHMCIVSKTITAYGLKQPQQIQYHMTKMRELKTVEDTPLKLFMYFSWKTFFC